MTSHALAEPPAGSATAARLVGVVAPAAADRGPRRRRSERRLLRDLVRLDGAGLRLGDDHRGRSGRAALGHARRAWLVAAGALCVSRSSRRSGRGRPAPQSQGQRAVVYATAVPERCCSFAAATSAAGSAGSCSARRRLHLLARDPPLPDHFGGFNARLPALRPARLLERARDLRRDRALLALGAAVAGPDRRGGSSPAVARRAAADALFHVQPGRLAALIAGLLVMLLCSPARGSSSAPLSSCRCPRSRSARLAPAGLTHRSASIAAATHDGHGSRSSSPSSRFSRRCRGRLRDVRRSVRVSTGWDRAARRGRDRADRGDRGALRPLRLAVDDRPPHLPLVRRHADRRPEPQQPPLLVLEQRADGPLALRLERVPRAPGRRRRGGWLPALVARAPHDRLLRHRHAQPLRADARRARPGRRRAARALPRPAARRRRSARAGTRSPRPALGAYVAYLVHARRLGLADAGGHAARAVRGRGARRRRPRREPAASSRWAGGGGSRSVPRCRRRGGRIRRADREHRARTQRRGAHRPKGKAASRRRRAHRWAPWSAQALRDLGDGNPGREKQRRAGRSAAGRREGSGRLGDLVRHRLHFVRSSARRGSCAGTCAQPGRPRAPPARASADGDEAVVPL